MIQLTLQFGTIEEAQNALAKLNGSAPNEQTKQDRADAVIKEAAPAPAAPAPAAPAPAAPAPAAPAPAAPAPSAAPVTVTAQQVNDAAVAKATAMGDQGAAIMGVLQKYGVTGLSQLSAEQLPLVLADINALGV